MLLRWHRLPSPRVSNLRLPCSPPLFIHRTGTYALGGRELHRALVHERPASRQQMATELAPSTPPTVGDNAASKDSCPVRRRCHTAGRDSLQRCHRGIPAVRLSRPCGPRCRPEVGVPLPERHPASCGPDLSKWWRRRESNPRPKVFCNDVYMHIRVVGGNPRPEAPFPLSVPHRINPANRGSEPIPCAHRRLGKTAGKARLGRRPFPPGRRGQEERGYLSSQCQFSVGFCFVSTVYERWTPDMQSLLHIPSSNPVRPPSSRD